jgi:hypothetical protein
MLPPDTARSVRTRSLRFGVRVTLPDGSVVLAHGRLDIVPSERPRPPDYALYLDERWREDNRVTWTCRLVDWPDFGIPDDEDEVFAAIVDLHERARGGQLVEVACFGGVGRTGTVLSCLAVLAGVPPEDAVTWVRTNYSARAVETDEQAALVARFAGQHPPKRP